MHKIMQLQVKSFSSVNENLNQHQGGMWSLWHCLTLAWLLIPGPGIFKSWDFNIQKFIQKGPKTKTTQINKNWKELNAHLFCFSSLIEYKFNYVYLTQLALMFYNWPWNQCLTRSIIFALTDLLSCGKTNYTKTINNKCRNIQQI